MTYRYGAAVGRRPGTFTFGRAPPLFERLIYYVLIPDLFARIVLEAILGQWWFGITQGKQWIFYLLMALEYVIQSRALVQDRFRKDENLVVSGLMLIMLLHGVFVGLAWQNPPYADFHRQHRAVRPGDKYSPSGPQKRLCRLRL